MNRETVFQPANSAQPADPATLAFSSQPAPAERVVEHLEKLASSLVTLAASKGGQGGASVTAEDEECLESYLQRYMQQLTGKSPEKEKEKAGQQPDGRATIAATMPSSMAQLAAEPQAAPQRQPVAAPEDRLTISAMREVANASARRAMAESTQIQIVVKTRTTYFAAKGLSLLSITMAVAYFATHSAAVLVSATVLFGIAFLLGVRFLGLCRKLGRMNAASA